MNVTLQWTQFLSFQLNFNMKIEFLKILGILFDAFWTADFVWEGILTFKSNLLLIKNVFNLQQVLKDKLIESYKHVSRWR